MSKNSGGIIPAEQATEREEKQEQEPKKREMTQAELRIWDEAYDGGWRDALAEVRRLLDRAEGIS